MHLSIIYMCASEWVSILHRLSILYYIHTQAEHKHIHTRTVVHGGGRIGKLLHIHSHNQDIGALDVLKSQDCLAREIHTHHTAIASCRRTTTTTLIAFA